MKRKENRKRLLACLLAVSMGAAAGTGCGAPGESNRISVAGGGEGALAPVKTIAQAEYPQEPVYKNDQERFEARHSRRLPERFQEAYGSFAIRTAAQVLGETDQDQVNLVYSPLGLYYALAMSAQGAQGETRQELVALLGYGEEPGSSVTQPESLAQDCRAAFQALYHVPNPENSKKNEWGELPEEALYNLRIANSLWADDALELKQAFADQAAQNFYSDIYQLDLHGPGVRETMTSWVQKRTGRVFPLIAGEAPKETSSTASGGPEETLLSLRNTVYYYDEWIDRFNKEKTAPDVFTTAKGTQEICDFMNRTMDSHGFRRKENFTASSLALKNGSMEFILPDAGVDVRELVKTPEILKEVLEGTGGEKMGEVVWKIPKFSYGSSTALTEALKALGVRRAFGGDADFTGISDYKPLGISGVSQDAHIGIDENGVEAAAFTEIAYAGAAPPDGRADMILDRPFLYAIRSQGQILFVGICGNPAVKERIIESGPQPGPGMSGVQSGPQPGPGMSGAQSGAQPGPEISEVPSGEQPGPGMSGMQARTSGAGNGASAVTAQDLLDARNPYIGNASADGTLVSLVLDYYGLKPDRTMELQTTDIPYGMTLHLNQEPDNITMQKAAGLLLALIDNCYSVSWDYPTDEQGNRAYYYLPATAFSWYEGIGFIGEYARADRQPEKMNALLEALERVDQPLAARSRARTLDQAVAAAILEHNRYVYSQDGEVSGEGHKVLGVEETDTTARVYALTMYGTYQFQDGNFVKDGGTGVSPAVIHMNREPDGTYVAVRYQKPEDGGGYTESIRNLFPEDLWDQCLPPAPSAQDREDLERQEQAYAKSYLEETGRKAAVGHYGEFPHTLLTDAGVPVEVSNALLDARNLAPDDPARFAPHWLGNIERLENGERYVYEQSYDADKQEIRFSKIRYGTGETVAQSVYDGKTGKKK